MGDENYHMVAYDSDAAMIKHYRVDKMEKSSILEEDCFTVRTDVIVSLRFFAWVFGSSESAQIIGPQTAADKMREHIQSVAGLN
nr:hypothetical protein [uncultured Oscillibacter sp.]